MLFHRPLILTFSRKGRRNRRPEIDEGQIIERYKHLAGEDEGEGARLDQMSRHERERK